MSGSNCASVEPIADDIVARIRAKILPVAVWTWPIIRIGRLPTLFRYVLCRGHVLEAVGPTHPRQPPERLARTLMVYRERETTRPVSTTIDLAEVSSDVRIVP